MRLPFCLLLLVLATSANAQSSPLADSVQRAIEAGVELADVSVVEGAVATAERELQVQPNDPLMRHFRAYGLYRAGTLVFGKYGSGRSRPYFDRARDELEPLVRSQTIPESFSLLGAVYGMQIASARVAMVAGMRLGPKSDGMMTRAMEAAPRNPRTWLLRGVGAFNRPAAFGGGMDRAESDLRKAIELFASDNPAASHPRWGLAESHIWLGRVHAARGRKEDARAEYRAALALQPKNAWVLETLLPALEGR